MPTAGLAKMLETGGQSDQMVFEKMIARNSPKLLKAVISAPNIFHRQYLNERVSNKSFQNLARST
jgi:hypothetical protein